MLKMRKLLRVVGLLLGLVLLSSATTSVEGQGPCGTWTSVVDTSVPLMSVVHAKGSADDCSAIVQITSLTGRIGPNLPMIGQTKLEGYDLDLESFASSNAIAEWSPAFGLIPQHSLLIPGIATLIRVRPNDRSLSASVRINGTINDASMTSDLAIFLLQTAMAVNPVPCTPDLDTFKTIVNSDVELYNQLRDTASLLSKKPVPDYYGAAQKMGQSAEAAYTRIGEISDQYHMSCIKDLVKAVILKFAEKIFLASDIEKAFLDFWLPMTVDRFLWYHDVDATATLVYMPLATPTPVPPPACFSLPISKHEPQDGQVLNAKNMALEWWTDYSFKSGEYFEVQVRAENGGWLNPGGDIKNPSGHWSLGINNLDAWSRGKYFWTVRVKGSDGKYQSCEDSNPFWFTLKPRDSSSSSSSSSSSYSSSSSSFCWLVCPIGQQCYIQCQ